MSLHSVASGKWICRVTPPLAGISISVMLFYTVGHLITHRTPLSGPPLTLWPQSQAREQETGQIPPPLLDVNNLTVSFPQAEGGDQRVVDGLNLTVAAGEKITVLGATGSGKSMLLLSLLGLLPWGGEVRGEIRINTEHPADMDARRLRTYRGLTVGYIPQNGGVSLNPVLSISRQVGERALVHQGLSRSRARRLARKQLLAVGLPERLCYSRTYVHQLSGGMRQRVLLAMALTANPHLVLADEPTKGLDPDARDAIGRLFKSLDDKTLITVTHDLELARSLEGTITVVFAGMVVESAPADLFFHSPLHPYSSALLAAQPSRGMRVESLVADPDACTGGTGCPYQPFCRQAEARCSERPGLKIFANRWIRCWHHAN
jgi:oligopeptide/dipeptide ABC transporter ATP-binding protein